ncbi:peptidoglycan editing factor PgeF [Thiomicrospira sp. R3]|uniref:peptidoglycan editing factor PgeF n=1 Tax=Thiomicrospira sp. R3 TaxID=3035472 RepID=UPI00259BAA87|nr:peptidoglycan editing factor PgeF [Thiomicrospira sp. R3]WFE68208.1 peptidoglycan editing factor PgeF [Thiomicrospira sp. R3]
MMIFPIIEPSWSVPTSVKALTTTRVGGRSLAPYASFNLAEHAGDSLDGVVQNRLLLQSALPSDVQLAWLDQQHTSRVVHFNQACLTKRVADAVWSDQPNQVCAVMTADCLPILLTSQSARLVAAVHAGWRGLAHGVIEQTLSVLPDRPENMIAWIGPAISQDYFEVGQDVWDVFCADNAVNRRFFKTVSLHDAKFKADLPGLAKQQLNALGVTQVYLSGMCSFAEASRFYSYRRDGQTGRMASLIWLQG